MIGEILKSLLCILKWTNKFGEEKGRKWKEKPKKAVSIIFLTTLCRQRICLVAHWTPINNGRQNNIVISIKFQGHFFSLHYYLFMYSKCLAAINCLDLENPTIFGVCTNSIYIFFAYLEFL